MKRQPTRLIGPFGLTVLAIAVVAGCGFNAEQQIADAVAAAGRSFIDQWLTDLANAAADARDQQNANDNDSQPPDNDNDNDGGDDAVGRGEALVQDNCAACHGADGASGFAPDIRGADDALIANKTGGEEGHTTIDLTDEQIADIAAFLADG